MGTSRKLDGGKPPPVDIITFGSPAGPERGIGQAAPDLRGADGLFLEAIRIIREMQEATNGEYPRFALWENVPGALSSSGRRDFKGLCLKRSQKPEVPMPRSGQWANAGMMVRGRGVDLAWCVYDAQYFGTAQQRRRIFLVADFRGERRRNTLCPQKPVRVFCGGRNAAARTCRLCSKRRWNSRRGDRRLQCPDDRPCGGHAGDELRDVHRAQRRDRGCRMAWGSGPRHLHAYPARL